MSDDLDKKVQQIAQMLGQNDLPDNVKELVALLAASLNKKDNKENAGDRPTSPDVGNKADSGEPAANQEPSVNSDALDSARNALARINAANDPRINLLQAIKPFMNSRRQKKIGNCIQLLQLVSLSRLLNEHEKQAR